MSGTALKALVSAFRFGAVLTVTPAKRLFAVLFMRMGVVARRPKGAAVEPPRGSRHANTSGMCEAQRVDFQAACEGKITWRQYYEKWGDAPAP